MDASISKLESLLDQKKFEEARQLIKEIVSAKMSDEEKADIFIGLGSAYLDITNAINARYLAALKEAVEGMEAINRSESKTSDDIRIREIKASLRK